MNEKEDFGFAYEVFDDGKKQVFLPHSCDEWVIAYSRKGDKEEIIKEFERFIKEAQDLLEEIKSSE